ncbi:MAG: hypothetical protein FJ146_01400 [Deltaproteobacteria bacterium]|nr:hypothetical protein [Deltaproteobacteria bacterium]
MAEFSSHRGAKGSSWLAAAAVLALVGLSLSLYSTLHHIEVHATGHTNAACNISSKFSCDEVALSEYSEIAGVPLGVWGLGYFAALLVLLAAGRSAIKTAKDHLLAYAVLVAVGVVTSLALGAIAVGKLNAYCVICFGIYGVTLLQAWNLVRARKQIAPRQTGSQAESLTFKGLINGLSTAAIAVALAVGLFNLLKPTRLPEKLDLPQTALAPKAAAPTPKVNDIPLSKSAYAGLGEDFRKGGDAAKVVVVEFADYQCPACGLLARNVKQLHEEFGDKVLFVFRNYPLDNSCNSSIPSRMHEYSCKAAVLARCAGAYGKFWQYHDRLFENQQAIDDAKLKEWAQALGLSADQIQTCLNSKDVMAKIKDDIDIGNRLGIDSTPTVFINGVRQVNGNGLDELRGQINNQLN